MNAKRDPDAIVLAWLEEGPSELPDPTRRAIAGATRVTHQARGRHADLARRTDMFRLHSFALVATMAVVAIVGVVALVMLTRPPAEVGGPGLVPSPSSSSSISPVSLSPEPTAAWTEFVSARHGYSVRHPSDWTVEPATDPWPYGTGVPGGPGNPAALDTFRAPFTGLRIVITSQLLPDGLSETEWRDDYRAQVVERYGQACFPPPDQWEHQTVDGVDLGIYGGCAFVEAMAFAGGRAYTFTIESPSRQSRPLYDEMLRTIRFDPEAADDSSVMATFTSERHGYSIEYPSDWTVIPATEPWPYGTGGVGGPGNAAALDRFTSSATPARIIITSQLLPDGLPEADWIEAYRAPVVNSYGEACFPPSDTWEHLTVDGVDLGRYTGCNFVETMAFTGGRVYTLTLENIRAEYRPMYDQMVESIDFFPVAADDTPADPSPSP